MKDTPCYLYLLFIVITCFSCGGQSETSEKDSMVPEIFQSYQLDIKEDKRPLAELIESLNITRLQETEESLLRYVGRIEFLEDKMIIPDNKGTIYIYSKTGEFLSKFNRKGDGPEEYSKLTDVWLANDIIGIYNYGKSVNRYDLEGNFLSRDNLNEQAAHLYPYKSGYALDMNIRYTQDSLKFSLITLDDQMKLDETFLPFDKHPGFRLAASLNSFSTLGDDLFYLRETSDTVYRIANDSVIPYIHYDFQDDWYFQPGVELRAGFYKESHRKKKVWFVLNHLGPNYIYLFTTLGPRMDYAFFIDRDTKQSVSIDPVTSTYERLDFSTIGWNDDEFLIALQSSQLGEFLEELDEEQYSFTKGTTLEEIESSENPVLIRMKIKESKNW